MRTPPLFWQIVVVLLALPLVYGALVFLMAASGV